MVIISVCDRRKSRDEGAFGAVADPTLGEFLTVGWFMLDRFNPLGPRPAAALSLWNPMRREVTVSNDPGIQL